MTAYYNEIDPYAAQWLRNLISAGHIAPGDVDERSILDVRPDDLTGYTQCHFFAGIGVWSYALRRAGWADDRPLWTGSCPCQPFSAAGKGGGFDDERHLWPHFHWLISQRRPDVVLGEQVASKDGLAWLDLVQADLEGTGYASGAVDLCAAGVGAPHIRQRLWWFGRRGVALADACGSRLEGQNARTLGHECAPAERNGRDGGVDVPAGSGREWFGAEPEHGEPLQAGAHLGRLGHSERIGTGRNAGTGVGSEGGPLLRPVGDGVGSSGPVRGLADTDSGACGQGRALDGGRHHRSHAEQGAGFGGGGVPDSYLVRRAAADSAQHANWNAASWNDRLPRPGPTNGLWRDADWLFCRDGKWRPVEPGTFPLAHGAASRVGRLRAYGNAIVAQAAQAFVEAYLDAER